MHARVEGREALHGVYYEEKRNMTGRVGRDLVLDVKFYTRSPFVQSGVLKVY